MKKILFLIPLVCLLAGIFGYIVGHLTVADQLQTLERLRDDGGRVYGAVTDKQPKNHARVLYRYIVDGKEFTGISGSGDGNPDFENLQIGQSVIVTYDLNDPESSILGYAEPSIERNYLLVFFTTSAMAVFAGVGLSIIVIAVYFARK